MRSSDLDTPSRAELTPGIWEYSVGMSTLSVTPASVYRALGYESQNAPEVVVHELCAALEEAPERVQIRVGYRLLAPDSVLIEDEGIRLCGQHFHTGKLVSKPLQTADGMAILVCTAGAALDAWMREAFEKGEMVRGYLIDAMGSEIAEQAADWAQERIRETAQHAGMGITNRYSPGYCGWHVCEQQALFALLPTRFCGVTLTSTALMQPVKSVSGVVGVGPRARQLEYQCKVCDYAECFRKNKRYL